MRIPFSTDDFLAVFERYNSDVWPVQIFFYALAIMAVVSLVIRFEKGSQMVNQLLSVLWLWMGIVYLIKYFSSINSAAYLFGGMFIIQGLIFAYLSVFKTKLEYEFNFTNIHGIVGIGLIFYGMVLYPVLNHLPGITFPASPTFGMPCPTTIFTFGLLLMATGKIPWYVFHHTVPLVIDRLFSSLNRFHRTGSCAWHYRVCLRGPHSFEKRTSHFKQSIVTHMHNF